MTQEERKHAASLLAIHERRIALTQARISKHYQGERERLPLPDLLQLENDEARVAELKKELGQF